MHADTVTFQRPLLEQAVAAAVSKMRLTLITAPPGSGKKALLKRVKAELTASGCKLSSDVQPLRGGINIIESFDSLCESERSRLAGSLGLEDCRYVILCESPHPFNRSGLWKDGLIAEFGIDDLALRREDVLETLSAEFGLERSNRHIRELLEKTEGWYFAWRLIAAELRENRPIAEIARYFSGGHPIIREYLDSYIDSALSPDVRQFLVFAGYFEPLDADLANTALARRDSLRLLEAAFRQTAFISQEGNGRSFKIHPLIRDYFEHAAEREDPQRYYETLARAAAWHETRANWLSAAHCHNRCGSTGRALQLLSAHADELITAQGEGPTFRRLAQQLPAEAASMLAPELALGSVFMGDYSRAAILLDDVTHREPSLSPQQRERLEAISFIVDYGFERFDEVIRHAPKWLDTHKNTEPRYEVLASVSLFWTCYADLDQAGMNWALDAYRQSQRRASSRFLKGWLAIMEATQYRELGRLTEAERSLNSSGAGGAIRPAMEVMRAAIALDMGDLPRAQQLMSRHFEASLQHGTIEVALLGFQTAIQLAALEQGLVYALQKTANAEAAAVAMHGDRGRRTIDLMRCLLMLKSSPRNFSEKLDSDIIEITRTIELFGPGARLRERGRLLRARHLTLKGEWRAAISIIQPIIREALQQLRLPVWCEASLIYAGALVRGGELDRATRKAWSTIERISSTDLRTCVTSEQVMLGPLMDSLISRADLSPTAKEAGARQLVQTLASMSGRLMSVDHAESASINSEVAPDAHLTKTELKIMELVAAGAANADIARHMIIRLSTVKWHMQNIFRKLDARSRTAAVAHARQLGLLD